jgi:uncharacterized protein YecE (DUF72 family)
VAETLIGCCGWNYGDRFEDGGWIGSFYPDTKTKKLAFYSQIFPCAEFDAIFYEKFYSKMGQATFEGMIKSTPPGFEFSVKVPETITHKARLSLEKGADTLFDEYLERISPLKEANKLGAILIQLPLSFTVQDFKQVESFLDTLPKKGYDYAIEFRHPSWQTEGPWELLKQYNVATVLTDSPDPKLQYLSDVSITADHAFIRLHGRKQGYWYDYRYSQQELKSWADKVTKIQKDPEVKRLRIMFNNHYRGSAVENALQFKVMMGEELTPEQAGAKNRVHEALASLKEQQKLVK